MKDEMIRLRLTSEEKVKIQNAAEEKGISVSQLMLNSVFNQSEGITHSIQPIKLSECSYKGLKFRFTLEIDNDEIVVMCRLYTNNNQHIKGVQYIFGRTAKEIAMYCDEFKARIMAENFIAMLESQNNNPYRQFMED